MTEYFEGGPTTLGQTSEAPTTEETLKERASAVSKFLKLQYLLDQSKKRSTFIPTPKKTTTPEPEETQMSFGDTRKSESTKILEQIEPTTEREQKEILAASLRPVAEIEASLGASEKQFADFISMARPFVREPYLVRNFREGKQEKAACISCNRCLAAVPNDYPVSCYAQKWPEKKEITISQ